MREKTESLGFDKDRRALLRLTGTGMAALGLMPFLNAPFAKAQDMSNDANNFYISDIISTSAIK